MRISVAAIAAALFAGVTAATIVAKPPHTAAATISQCGESGVDATVRNFVDAFNSGSADQLATFFAADPGFRWFSVSAQATGASPGALFVAYSRPTLLRYLERRQSQTERLTLESLTVAAIGGSSERGFTYELVRQADDLDHGKQTRYTGKGAVDCTSGPARIVVWSMGAGGPRPPLRPGNGKGTWGRLRRPLGLFRLAPGSDCPRSFGRAAHDLSRDFGTAPALGNGPVYPIVSTGPEDSTRETAATGVVPYTRGRSEGGWFYIKVLWIESPRYRGPVLVRGRQLNGPRLVRFESGPRPAAELRLWGPGAGIGGGWLGRPSEMRLRGSGCYGLQVDGKNFSKTIVFEAR